MTEKVEHESAQKMPTAVLITLIICGTIAILSIAGMLVGVYFGGKFGDRFLDELKNHQVIIREYPANSVNNLDNSNQNYAQNSENYIGEDKARDIVLSDAKIALENANNLRIFLDRDDGVMKYEVEFTSGETEYDYEVGAVDGKILSREIDNIYD